MLPVIAILVFLAGVRNYTGWSTTMVISARSTSGGMTDLYDDSLLNNDTQRIPNRHWAEKVDAGSACPSGGARYIEAITKVTRAISYDYLYTLDLTNDAAVFAEFASSCPSAGESAAALYLAAGDYARAAEVAARGAAAHPKRAKALLWKGLTTEATAPGPQVATYSEALSLDPALGQEYFGVDGEAAAVAGSELQQRLSILGRPRPRNSVESSQAAQRRWEIMRKGAAHVLLGREFGRWYGSFAPIVPAMRRAWRRNWFHLVENFVDPHTTAAAAATYRELVAGGLLDFRDLQSARYVHVNDPVARLIACSVAPQVTRLTTVHVKPTYTYFGGYVGGAELPPHHDRPQCEFTASFHVEANPASAVCPLNVGTRVHAVAVGNPTRPQPHEVRTLYPRAGDAMLLKGRQLTHWRDPLPEGVNCSNVFLHFIHAGSTLSLD